jgi:TonB family protein
MSSLRLPRWFSMPNRWRQAERNNWVFRSVGFRLAPRSGVALPEEQATGSVPASVQAPALVWAMDRRETRVIEGRVMLELIVRANGSPTNIRVTRSLDPDGLDGEAVRAASQWRFAPGRLNGNRVDVAASIQIDFHVR